MCFNGLFKWAIRSQDSDVVDYGLLQGERKEGREGFVLFLLLRRRATSVGARSSEAPLTLVLFALTTKNDEYSNFEPPSSTLTIVIA